MVNLMILNIELSNRLWEVGEKCRDPSLTEEEKKYYGQLYERIYDEQTEVIKEMREQLIEDHHKFFKETDLDNHLKKLNTFFKLDPNAEKFNKKVDKWRKRRREY